MVFNIISDYYPFAPGYTKTRYTGGIHKDGNKWRQALYAVAHMNVRVTRRNPVPWSAKSAKPRPTDTGSTRDQNI